MFDCFVQFDLSKMLWLSGVGEKKKQFWIRICEYS